MYNDRKELRSIVLNFVEENGIDLQYYLKTFSARYFEGKKTDRVDDIIGYFVITYGRNWKHGHYLEAGETYSTELKTWIYQHELLEYFEMLGCFLPAPSAMLPIDEVLSKNQLREFVLICFKKHHTYSTLEDYSFIFSYLYWHEKDINDSQVIVDYFVNTAYRPWKTKWIYEHEVIDYFNGMDYMYEVMANID